MIAAKVTLPRMMRPKATCAGSKAATTTFMRRKLAPQTSDSAANIRGTVLLRTGARVGGADTVMTLRGTVGTMLAGIGRLSHGRTTITSGSNTRGSGPSSFSVGWPSRAQYS